MAERKEGGGRGEGGYTRSWRLINKERVTEEERGGAERGRRRQGVVDVSSVIILLL